MNKKQEVTVKSFAGGHDINIYTDCIFDPGIRKYRAGTLLKVIPYSGRMLNAYTRQAEEELCIDGTVIPVKSRQVFTAVDELPDEAECDYCVVSAMYVSACRELGKDTSRLLTIGDTVVDGDGRVIGCINFNKN